MFTSRGCDNITAGRRRRGYNVREELSGMRAEKEEEEKNEGDNTDDVVMARLY